MYVVKPLFAKVIMSVLITILSSVSMLGNGFILAVLARFKSLQTVPNILLANLALVDLLNAVITVPMYMIYTTLEVSWFRGKTLAITTAFLDRVFIAVNLGSRLALVVNMYLGISFDFEYRVWKTNKKALVFVFLIWLISIVLVMLFSIPLLDIDLGDAHVTEYRAEIYKQGKHFVAAFMILFILCGTALGFMMNRAIKRKRKERAEMNLPPLQAEARLKTDIKASKTISITIAAYFACYVPSVVYAIVAVQKKTLAESWFGFFAYYSLYLSSAVNPIIYYVRSSRFRSAFRQFLKDPLGSSDIKAKLRGQNNGEVRKIDVMASKRNGKDALGAEADGKQTRQKISEGQGNDIMFLSFKNAAASASLGSWSMGSHREGSRGSFIKSAESIPRNRRANERRERRSVQGTWAEK
ncbi:hypothetical protein OS493_021515 [Desmophyllum pertusum]|uniref:G-protein coupled receptors family 1 profile domain-containing protein n=1 Tax=Desmophyllum pertusum TaxID=174260 RepID=A0A9X0CLB9_9CNID|nr:hypothetical protein OS493_021515 [Desmophyllum pertusum]